MDNQCIINQKLSNLIPKMWLKKKILTWIQLMDTKNIINQKFSNLISNMWLSKNSNLNSTHG